MLRKTTCLVVLILLCMSADGFGDVGRALVDLPLAIDKNGQETDTRTGHRAPPLLESAAITWTIVDSMPNAFGTASRGVKPITYDPASNTLAIIYRGHLGYSASVGQLWYSISRDGGASWRRVSELNAGVPLSSRYPSCDISNPTNTSDTSGLLFAYAAPQVLPGGSGFGHVMYGVDLLGQGTPFALNDEGAGTYWSNLPIWSKKGADHMIFWVCYTGTVTSDYNLWRTSDYVTIVQGVPPTWTSSNFNASARRDVAGYYRNGTSYFATYGSFLPPDPGEVFNVGYSRSTNDGASWSGWTFAQPDWRSVPGIGLNYDIWNYGGPGNFSIEYAVDANNRSHFMYVIYDTLTADRKLIEIYETGTGWNSKTIQPDMRESTILGYPASTATGGILNQMGNHLQVSMNPSGTVLSLVWLDANAPGDSLADIWFSARHIGGEWSAPVNLTVTPELAELCLHAAPTLRDNGGDSYTVFLGRTYGIGTSTYPPDGSGPSYFFAGSHTFTVGPSDVSGNGSAVPSEFRLAQNFPNPFNPTTRIEYALPVSTDVVVTVYNTLGQEVARMQEGVKAAGIHSLEFAADGLPSGVYLYTLRAGGHVETRKMMVLK